MMTSLVTIALSVIISFHISSPAPALAQPSISEPKLTAELVLDGLSSPTSIAFLDENNILLLEKEGSVRLISNGQLQPQPVLQLQGVESNNERGLLGIEVMGDKVFLYVTESGAQVEGIPSEGDVRNRVYSYTWDGTALTSPQLLLDLPSGPGTNHQGGKIKIGSDNQLYVIVGEMQREGQLQNFQSGPAPDDTGVILRVNPADGSPSPGNPLSSDPSDPLSKYYAYGIRNSFGIDFDPLTHKLWDTENGPDYGDEINLVEAGFNSGWNKVQGIWKPIYNAQRGGDLIAGEKFLNSDIKDLVIFNGNGKYSEPEFTWNHTAGPTQITFLKSDKFPEKYKDDLFIGDTNNGYLYSFDLNENRTSFILKGALEDKVADSPKELDDVILGQGFGHITDLEVGPDGYLYVLSHNSNTAMIFKITSNDI